MQEASVGMADVKRSHGVYLWIYIPLSCAPTIPLAGINLGIDHTIGQLEVDSDINGSYIPPGVLFDFAVFGARGFIHYTTGERIRFFLYTTTFILPTPVQLPPRRV
ncbi:hypothetical protein BDV41DRAFT_581895 [Aspergillus transmontanensis]|uniref:Uncharacterized protein n=1 Tax=Aspergillus transmontanensis TaxID=1034304 RepID=A0A5N6VI43_9EURO|nr:hypothetical protein BDV41DRAFT_581895 [Aspergillus transmontanensis]